MPKITDTVESFMDRAIKYAEQYPEEIRPLIIATYASACATLESGRKVANGLDDVAASLTDIAYTIKRGISDADKDAVNERSPERDGT